MSDREKLPAAQIERAELKGYTGNDIDQETAAARRSSHWSVPKRPLDENTRSVVGDDRILRVCADKRSQNRTRDNH